MSVWGNTDLYQKIESLVGRTDFDKNRAFIEIIFTPSEAYFVNDHLDVVKVVQTLKENGLLNLTYEKPQPLELTFTTNGSPMYFVKLMGDTLRAMGYYRYATSESRLDNSTFYWKIILNTKHATDPVTLRDELRKRGCDITDIIRENRQAWSYEINMSDAHLELAPLEGGEEVVFKRSLYAHWLNVSKVKRMTVWSFRGNNWYPYLAFYDSSLRLLKVYKRNKKSWQVTVNPPRDTAYVRISDLYSLKNIKDGLRIEVKGTR
jgi:hypothetical protein